MHKRILLLFFVSLSILRIVFSQGTIKVMSYNLLNFNNYTSYCTQSNNNHVNKAVYLKTIVKNQNPDILICNEVGTNISANYTINYILGNSLNTDGETKWLAAAPTGSYLVNGFFYDKNKFELLSQPVISTSVRDINVYRLRYKLATENIYFNVIIAHLKAGRSSVDAISRAEMIDNLYSWLNSQGNNENYIIAGDFNVYTSNEAAFQKLINPNNPALAFYDPVNKLGDWNNNYNFRNYHTQSTHADFDSDCHSGGGLDDRFDFILISGSIKDGTAGIKYKENTYWALGQDGNRFNQSINSPVNKTLPDEVISAIYNMSDHLPVVSEFYFGEQNSVITASTNNGFYANVVSPICDNIVFQTKTNFRTHLDVSIYSISGQKLKSFEICAVPNEIFYYNISDLNDGLYILNFSGKGIYQAARIVKMRCE